MRHPLFASSEALTTAPVILAVLVACLIVLGLMSWSGASGAALSRRVVLLLNGTLGVLVVLFVVLVVVRFETLA
jgi:hypothetical protein